MPTKEKEEARKEVGEEARKEGGEKVRKEGREEVRKEGGEEAAERKERATIGFPVKLAQEAVRRSSEGSARPEGISPPNFRLHRNVRKRHDNTAVPAREHGVRQNFPNNQSNGLLLIKLQNGERGLPELHEHVVGQPRLLRHSIAAVRRKGEKPVAGAT